MKHLIDNSKMSSRMIRDKIDDLNKEMEQFGNRINNFSNYFEY